MGILRLGVSIQCAITSGGSVHSFQTIAILHGRELVFSYLVSFDRDCLEYWTVISNRLPRNYKSDAFITS